MAEAKEGRVRELREIGKERRGSDGMWEVWKRKRELEERTGMEEDQGQGEVEQIFQKSKKTPRSPGKRGGEGGELMVEMMREWMEECKGRWEKVEENMNAIRRELEDMRKREEEWRKEKMKMEKRLEDLEVKWKQSLNLGGGGKRWEELEKRVGVLERGDGILEVGGEGRIKEAERRVRELERAWEKRERQERKRNLIVKGLKEEGKDVKTRVEEILERIGAKVEVEEARMMKTGKEEWGGRWQ